jgi:hypothetical protein
LRLRVGLRERSAVSTAARTRCLLSLCALLLALGPLPTHAATPEETTRARELGQEAAELFRSEQYEAALEKFTEANRLVPHPNLDVNIGRAYEKLGQADQALIHCKIALNAPGVPDATRAAAQQCVERVQKLLVRPVLKVESRPTGATVRIDGKVVGETPWRGEVEAGRRQIDLELAGYGTSSRNVAAERGNVYAVEVTLTAAAIGGLLTVTSTPTGASIFLDREEVGLTPMRNFQVQARTYVLEVRKDGFTSDSSTVTVEDGKLLERMVTLVPIGGSPGRDAPLARWPGWTLVGASAVAFGLGGYFGKTALDKHDEADRLARTSAAPEDKDAYDALVADMEGNRLASDLLIVGGGVMLTGGLTWLLWPDAEAAPEPQSADAEVAAGDELR